MSTRTLAPPRSRRAAARASADAAELLTKPHEERRQIVVVRDMAYKAAKRPRRRAWWQWAALALAGLFMLFFLPWLLLLLLPIAIPVMWWRSRKKKVQRTMTATDIVPVPRSVAAHLRFMPADHQVPKPDVVYIANPVEPGLFYPAAEFHPLTFHHKLREAVEILDGLGAAEIEAEHVSGSGKELLANLSIPLPLNAAEAGFVAERREGQRSDVLFKAVVRNPNATPKLPKPLYWYPGEQLWQMAVELWENRRLKTIALDLTYAEDIDVTAGLEGKVRDVGLKLGGQMRRVQNTTWRIKGIWSSDERLQPVAPGRAVGSGPATRAADE